MAEQQIVHPPAIQSLNHLKIPVHDVRKTQDFYVKVMGMEYIPNYDHKKPNGQLFASMVRFQHEGKDIIVEFRLNAAQAKAQERWDPITFGVKTRADLDAWRKWFEVNNVKQGPKIFTGLKGWLLVAADPDGKFIHIYCDEEHEWTTEFDNDEDWMPLDS